MSLRDMVEMVCTLVLTGLAVLVSVVVVVPVALGAHVIGKVTD